MRPAQCFISCVALAFAACSDAAGPASELAPDRLIFVSDRDTMIDPLNASNGILYRMNVDGTDITRIGPLSYYNGLRLSPDGRRLAFYSDNAGCFDIHVMDVEDTTAIRLTGVQQFERCNVQPHWSLDGSRIAFSSSRNAAYGWDAYVMNANGSGLVKLIDNPNTSIERSADYAAGWAPDGRVLVTSDQSGVRRPYLVGANGADPTDMLDVWGGIPYWSHAGSHVVVDVDGDLWVMNPDGSAKVNVTDHPDYDYLPNWSSPWAPDGSRLAFTSRRRSGDEDIWVVKPDGSGSVNITPTAGDDQFLQWLPDSHRILFASNRTGEWDLYLVNADGSGLKNVTHHPANDIRAVWVPGR
jgi:Tol biopolymer transport system component